MSSRQNISWVFDGRLMMSLDIVGSQASFETMLFPEQETIVESVILHVYIIHPPRLYL